MAKIWFCIVPLAQAVEMQMKGPPFDFKAIVKVIPDAVSAGDPVALIQWDVPEAVIVDELPPEITLTRKERQAIEKMARPIQ
jgi:hypothetical protein